MPAQSRTHSRQPRHFTISATLLLRWFSRAFFRSVPRFAFIRVLAHPPTQTLTLVFASSFDKDVASDARARRRVDPGKDRRTCSRLPAERERMVDDADYCKVTR